jgi:ribosomal protein S21
MNSHRFQEIIAKNFIFKDYKKQKRYSRAYRFNKKKSSNVKELLSVVKKYERLRSFDGKRLPKALKKLKKKLKELSYINNVNRYSYRNVRKIGNSKIRYSQNRVSRIAKQQINYSYDNRITRIGKVQMKYQFGKIKGINTLKIKYRNAKLYKIGEYRLR